MTPLPGQTLGRAALAAIAFSVTVAAILVVIYRADRRDNPLASARLQQLKSGLVARPTDDALKEQIRQVDLNLREAHLRRRALLARGGYLLLAGVAVSLLCLKYSNRTRVSALETPPPLPPVVDPHASSPLAMRAISAIAILIGASLAAAMFVPSHQFGAASRPTAAADWPSDAELARNWPWFRGASVGVAQSSIVADWDGATGRNILWKSPIPLPGQNSPIVWENSAFLSGASEGQQEVYCFDAATGSLRWQRDVGNPQPLRAPKVMDETGYAAPTMATDGRRAYAIFATGDVVAVDFSGQVAWEKSLGLPDNQYGHAASLVMWHDRLIVQLDQGLEPNGRSALIALNAATGSVVWKTPRPVAGSWTSPILISTPTGPQIITAADPWVIAYHPQTGDEIWRAKCLAGDTAPSPAFGAGHVVVAMENSSCSIIKPDGAGDVTSTHIVWSVEEGLPDIVSPLVAGDSVILVSSTGLVSCYDLRDGKKLWEQDADGPFHASPLLTGNIVHLINRKGVMHRFEAAAEYKPLVPLSLGEAVSATPAVADGRLYIRGEKNLYCIGSPK